jgi:Zn-dependent protease with chaperone function
VIQAGSAIGFALAYLVVAWSVSAVLCAGALLARASLARRGPGLERAAAASALLLGPVAGLLLMLSLSGHSLATLWFGWADHCGQHGHHPHLCWLHGGGWADRATAVVPLAMLAAFVLVRVVQKLSAAWSARRALARLERIAAPGPGGLLIAPSERIFCFAAGLRRPRVYISSAAWRLLDEEQRRAVLAHERAHVAHGDLAADAALAYVALFAAPLLGRRVLAMWRAASERLCDQRAAAEVDSAAVAGALVALARAAAPAPAGVAFASPAGVIERVEALLADSPADSGAARRFTRGVWIAIAGLGVTAAVFADPLHHALETLLGVC